MEREYWIFKRTVRAYYGLVTGGCLCCCDICCDRGHFELAKQADGRARIYAFAAASPAAFGILVRADRRVASGRLMSAMIFIYPCRRGQLRTSSQRQESSNPCRCDRPGNGDWSGCLAAVRDCSGGLLALPRGTNPVGPSIRSVDAFASAVWGCICLILLFISYHSSGQCVGKCCTTCLRWYCLLLFLFRRRRNFFAGVEGEKKRAHVGCDRTSGSTAGAFDLRADPAERRLAGAVPSRGCSR